MTTEPDLSDASYEELYDEAPCGYVSTSPEGVIVRVNRTFLELTGFSATELLAGRRFSALLAMPSTMLYETSCAPILRLRGSISEIALDVSCRDGKPLPVLLSAVAKKDATGAPYLFRIVILNAPTRREYERELRRARTQADEATEQVRILHELAERKVAEQHALLQAVARIAAGDLMTPVVIASSSSQAELARGLDQMRQDIQKQIRELEERNTEVQQLNVELRHQIESRSRQLIDSMEAGINANQVSRMDYSTTEVMPLLPNGAMLTSRYRVEAILGQGAMGTVYEVQRTSDGRRFAAKVLGVKPDYHAMVRFAREAQLLARLRHPNLISIVDADVTQDRVAYIVMELARGQSLAELAVHYGKRDLMLPLLRQIANALTIVHHADVVHRDLKPSNVIVTIDASGGPAIAKLVDFGISRLLDHIQDSWDAAATTDGAYSLVSLAPRSLGLDATLDAPTRAAPGPVQVLSIKPSISDPSRAQLAQPGSAPSSGQARRRSTDELTQAGTMLGTPLYMAPELGRGASLARPPADIFSFGVMSYEVLAGILPFEGLPVVLAASGTGELRYKPLDSLCPGLAPKLVQLLHRCLAVEPADRPTADELAVALT